MAEPICRMIPDTFTTLRYRAIIMVTCCLFLWCQVEPASTEPRCWRSDPPEWNGSKAQTKPGMDQSMAMSINCKLMIELYIRYYVYVCEALVTWLCKMCCIWMLWLIINIFWIWFECIWCSSKSSPYTIRRMTIVTCYNGHYMAKTGGKCWTLLWQRVHIQNY